MNTRYKIQIYSNIINNWYTIAIYNTIERATEELLSVKRSFPDKYFQLIEFPAEKISSEVI